MRCGDVEKDNADEFDEFREDGKRWNGEAKEGGEVAIRRKSDGFESHDWEDEEGGQDNALEGEKR